MYDSLFRNDLKGEKDGISVIVIRNGSEHLERLLPSQNLIDDIFSNVTLVFLSGIQSAVQWLAKSFFEVKKYVFLMCNVLSYLQIAILSCY